MDNNLILYFDHAHCMKKEGTDEPKYAPTSLRSWNSMFLAFYRHTGRGDLAQKIPIILSNIGKWEKTYTAKKATCFEADDISKLFF